MCWLTWVPPIRTITTCVCIWIRVRIRIALSVITLTLITWTRIRVILRSIWTTLWIVILTSSTVGIRTTSNIIIYCTLWISTCINISIIISCISSWSWLFFISIGCLRFWITLTLSLLCLCSIILLCFRSRQLFIQTVFQTFWIRASELIYRLLSYFYIYLDSERLFDSY